VVHLEGRVTFLHFLLSERGIGAECLSRESAEQLQLVPISRSEPPSP